MTQIGAVETREPVDEPAAVDVDQLAALTTDEHRDLGVLVVAHVGEVQQQVVTHLLLDDVLHRPAAPDPSSTPLPSF